MDDAQGKSGKRKAEDEKISGFSLGTINQGTIMNNRITFMLRSRANGYAKLYRE
jgi:hypothetical protein